MQNNEMGFNNNFYAKENAYQRKPYFSDFSRKDNVFKIIFCVASVLLAFLGLWGGFQAGFTVTSLILFVSMTVYFASNKTRIKPFALSCGILNCLVSVSFLITSNSTIRTLSVFSMILLSAIWFLSLVIPYSKESDYSFFCKILSPIAIGSTVSLPRAFMSFFVSRKGDNKKFGKIMLGIAFSVPVLFIVVPLLIKSDAAFSGFIVNFFGNFWSNTLKVLVGLIIGWFLVSYCFTVTKRKQPDFKKPDFFKIDRTIVVSFLSVLGVCYLMYLFSQLAYFFSAFNGILPEGFKFTVSAYARRGFFEMCTIAVINFIIIYATLLFTQRKDGKIGMISKILCIFIGFFTLIIIATAISKMALYISRFGMTELRITTSAFMIFLAIVFISIMIKVFIPKIRVLKVAIVTAASVLFILGTVNVNQFIADYNYTAYKNHTLKESIDVYSIFELGDEGVPYLVKLADDESKSVRKSAEKYLNYIIESQKYYQIKFDEDTYDYKIGEKRYDEIGQYSVARSRAYDALYEYIKKNPDVLYSLYEDSNYDEYEFIEEENDFWDVLDNLFFLW